MSLYFILSITKHAPNRTAQFASLPPGHGILCLYRDHPHWRSGRTGFIAHFQIFHENTMPFSQPEYHRAPTLPLFYGCGVWVSFVFFWSGFKKSMSICEIFPEWNLAVVTARVFFQQHLHSHCSKGLAHFDNHGIQVFIQIPPRFPQLLQPTADRIRTLSIPPSKRGIRINHKAVLLLLKKQDYGVQREFLCCFSQLAALQSWVKGSLKNLSCKYQKS